MKMGSKQAQKIYVAGHRGMVGSAIVRHIAETAAKPRGQVLDEIDDYVGELLAAMGP